LARVCLAGRAARAGFVVAAGADCDSFVDLLDCTGAVLVARFGCGVGFADLVLRIDSGSTVSALFDRVVRLALDSGSCDASCGCAGPASSSSWSSVVFFDRVALGFGAGCEVLAAVAAVAAVARLTGFLRSVRLASWWSGCSVWSVRAPRRVATIISVVC
jgi:hypothetical protein